MEWWQDGDRRDELLMRRSRIRRADAMPKRLHTLDGKAPELAGEVGPYQLHARVDQRRRSVGWTGSGVMRRRNLFHVCEGSEPVAAIRCTEYWVWAMDADDLFFVLDADSHAEMVFGAALTENWESPGFDLGGYGPLLTVDSVWCARQKARERTFARVLDLLLSSVFEDCGAAFAHLFPFEYEGRAPDDRPAHVGFRRRQDAMIRMARDLFGAQRLLGEAGGAGWVWLPIEGKGAISAPSLEPRVPPPDLRLVT
tara:strand:+ start:271 stop:1032 length:762 start_codon:yes stop_codon:yes gene_type:complete